MPCFKGIAVSIHANSSPLSEYGMQKQSRMSRISTYIPVPSPQLNPDTSQHEPARFAISITLLTPGHPIPYTQPKKSPANPDPKPLYAGPLPSAAADPSKHANTVTPYIPMTNSENETIAAYIYFDGRAKEEVATLLRPGEETWVNSRWVQVPDSEGGGLAEREFLFREVGLERWLNGLDLQGHDAAEKVEKRRQKFERRHRRQKSAAAGTGMDLEKTNRSRDTLAYGNSEQSPLADGMEDSDSDSLSDDDDEPPEATGQIKVAMFRVIASGEIKKGEYSPQFDAHDDDDDENSGAQQGGSNGVDASVEHTTSFAKPKTLDPKTISTQTVTGIDGPDKPYAVFTFFYRGQRQLSKMGILPSAKDAKTTTPGAKRRSTQLDFSNLGPLKTTGTVGFSAFRDQDTERRKSRKKSNGSIGGAMVEDSDDDDDDANPLKKMEAEYDLNKVDKSHLAPEDAEIQAELKAGIDRIRLKRQHSAEPDSAAAAANRKSPSTGPTSATTPTDSASNVAPAAGVANLMAQPAGETTIGSPLKKHRPSADEGAKDRSAGFPSALGDVLGRATANQQMKETAQAPPAALGPKDESDEEL
ncbi:hypothetical protein JX265_001320 [Neoarthrinium moseri]|uniref:DUF7918 domain-containing protein n=1 Tax=Neoarthrinium moseri TaxID=1658444 RepID=A0A9Q0AV27_9PEZI|nr:uncharacterized protein JN550_010772 [Neoarthrinium moseri]KAI1842011.1 hypothetical protein JX266_011766 [Neoarthrinium moseri]KAI1861702.1 hypothetical protein JN550_010772 [Neoarthrinium moseri]KAI1881080.1 hypothetical protein JX265_001320 [Neoarthrinium moseri]